LILSLLGVGLGSTYAEEFLNVEDGYRASCYAYGKYSFFDLRALEKETQDYMLLTN